MQMQPTHIDKIVRDEKTETRRLVKPGETLFKGNGGRDYVVSRANGKSPRVKWQVGRDYAVQPGRCEPGVYVYPGEDDRFYAWDDTRKMWGSIQGSWYTTEKLDLYGFQPLRIRILEIRQEDVRNINDKSVRGEGFDSKTKYLEWWSRHYDEMGLFYLDRTRKSGRTEKEVMYEFLGKLHRRPERFWKCWAIKFEKVM